MHLPKARIIYESSEQSSSVGTIRVSPSVQSTNMGLSKKHRPSRLQHHHSCLGHTGFPMTWSGSCCALTDSPMMNQGEHYSFMANLHGFVSIQPACLCKNGLLQAIPFQCEQQPSFLTSRKKKQKTGKRLRRPQWCIQYIVHSCRLQVNPSLAFGKKS